MLPKEIVATIVEISNLLRNRNIAWVLGGSTSLALQGVKVKPKDIDILTDEKGAYAINRLLARCAVKSVQFRQAGLFQSHFGEFAVRGIKVEVMGGLRIKMNKKWRSYSQRLKSPRFVNVGGLNVPVSPLKDQLSSYAVLGRKKDRQKIELIRRYLQTILPPKVKPPVSKPTTHFIRRRRK